MSANGSTGFWRHFDPCAPEVAPARLSEVLHPVLAAVGVGAWRYQPDIQCFFFDELLRELFGLPADGPLSTREVLDRIHPGDREAWQKMMDASLSNTVFRSSHRTLVNEQILWMDWTGKKSADDESIVGICVNKTEEMAMQEKLSAGEKRFRAIAMGAPGQFGYMDRSYNVQFMSKELRDALRLGHDNHDLIIGRHTSEVFGAEIFEDRKPLFDRALAGELVKFDDVVTLDDGTKIYHLVTYKPDIDFEGAVQGVFTLRTDFTERHRLEDDLRKTTEELSRSNSDLEQFAYVASHDLKAPLRSIQVLVEWLREDLIDYQEGDVQENLDLLSKRTRRLNSLLEDLLNYSRVGREAEAVEAVDVKSMVNEIEEMLDPEQEVNFSMNSDLGTMMADPAALHQVLRNLIGNAIKHHPGGQIEIVISLADEGSHYELSVADNGDGIPEEFSKRIFQMFQTLRPRDEVEGSGMGLAIVERIIRDQGGEIWLETPENGGAEFKFTWSREKYDER